MEVRFFRDEFRAVVHLYREGKDQLHMQMPAYRGRTELLKDSIVEGRVSLRLKKVTLSDAGLYGCWFRSQNNDQEATWELHVSDRRRKHEGEELREARKHAVEVTLDPETAHPQLYISDLKAVRYRNISQVVTDSDKRFARKCVVASQGFQAGKHYWEVDVGHNEMWGVGVCRDDVNRKVVYVTLSPNYGYWVLRMTREQEYLTLTPRKINLPLRTPPTKVGVLLDYEGGAISFFNVDDQSHIYTLTYQFEGLLRPYIQYYTNDEKKAIPIEIHPVSQEPEKEATSDTHNLAPAPLVTTPFLPKVVVFTGNHTSHSLSGH
ncbi:PREDICTED: butyrophilin-like protein 8 [Hipposideros armiger]|uniref:Butyrophilin-like protein 8 n=1 Tax=Hipposideros armiger TaxID=186990 RepID=A0A8B7QQJ0_HIPAR|nr:PREDICTED: butyrophilin-like protein 8 [Hipposideros armiger]